MVLDMPETEMKGYIGDCIYRGYMGDYIGIIEKKLETTAGNIGFLRLL